MAPYIGEAKILDLFAGSGSLGIEALSRGAQCAVFSDRNEQCIEIIKNNLIHTKLTEKAQVFLGEAELILKKLSQHSEKFDIIFLDPPYRKGIIPQILLYLEKNNVLEDRFIIVAESDYEDELPVSVGCMVVSKKQIYGKTKLTFYKRNL